MQTYFKQMKKIIYSLLIGAAILLSFSCEKSSDAPTCKITSPAQDQEFSVNAPLVITGEIAEKGSPLSYVELKIGSDIVAEVVPAATFRYEVEAGKLSPGELKIILSVKDAAGRSAEDQVSVVMVEAPAGEGLIESETGEDFIEFDFRADNGRFIVNESGNWTITLSETPWVEFYDAESGSWKNRTTISGNGRTEVDVRAIASDLFEGRETLLNITTTGATGVFTLKQAASPDMLTLIEDEMLRMAAGISATIYGMDVNEDGKVSAFEADIVPEDGVPYGIDAGGWEVASTKGIENFPHIRHLDVNTGKLSELDLSGNKEIMSLHIHNCPNLKDIDISGLTDLLEVGCDFRIFLKIQPDIKKIKSQIHTLGIFNREDGETSELDFSGFNAMQRLYLSGNRLTSLNLSGCTMLWRLIADGNDFSELDISEVDRHPDNNYIMTECPNLKRVYVWKGFTPDYYAIFSYDEGVEFIEK